MFRNAFVSISSILDIGISFLSFYLVYQSIFIISQIMELSYVSIMYENYVQYVLYGFTLLACTQFGGINLFRSLTRHMFKPGEKMSFYWFTDDKKTSKPVIEDGELLGYVTEPPSSNFKSEFLDPDEEIWIARLKNKEIEFSVPVTFLIGATP